MLRAASEATVSLGARRWHAHFQAIQTRRLRRLHQVTMLFRSCSNYMFAHSTKLYPVRRVNAKIKVEIDESANGGVATLAAGVGCD